MRVFSLIPALAALVTAVAGLSLPRQDDCKSEMGCDISITKRDFPGEHAARTVRGLTGAELTNAELLRRGLPLKGPIMRRGTPVRRHSPSGTPPEPQPESHRGIIKVKSLKDNSVLGYVSKFTREKKQYLYQGIENALIVTFETPSSGPSTRLNLIPENSDITSPGFLGIVQGRDNGDSVLAAGSFQYAYLANTNKTPPGAIPEVVGNSYGPTRTSESAVWTYDSGAKSLTPYWVNPDGSTPSIEHFVQSTGVYLGGDSVAFFNRYPAPVALVAFEFVPI